MAGSTPDNGNTKDAKIAAPLKYLGNFWRSLEMPLINCEINLILTWYGNVLFLLQLEKQHLQ